MNAAAMAPFGSFSGTTNQEMTGFYPATPALTVEVPYTPQSIYDATDATHLIVNNQMKGSAGPMNQGMWYSAQTHLLELPAIDFNTFETSPTELDDAAEAYWLSMYGRFRRRLTESFGPPDTYVQSTWSNEDAGGNHDRDFVRGDGQHETSGEAH